MLKIICDFFDTLKKTYIYFYFTTTRENILFSYQLIKKENLEIKIEEILKMLTYDHIWVISLSAANASVILLLNSLEEQFAYFWQYFSKSLFSIA